MRVVKPLFNKLGTIHCKWCGNLLKAGSVGGTGP